MAVENEYSPNSEKRKQQEFYENAVAGAAENKNPAIAVLFIFIAAALGLDVGPMISQFLGGSGYDGPSYASPDAYEAYDARSGGRLGGRDNARRLGQLHQDYQVSNAPPNWGVPSQAVIDKLVRHNGEITVYEEQKGDGYVSYGSRSFVVENISAVLDQNGRPKDGIFVTDFPDGSGRYVVSFPQLSGGAGRGRFPGVANGTDAADPKYPDAGKIPHYTMTNYRERGSKFGVNDDGYLSYTYDILSEGNDYVAGTNIDGKGNRGAGRDHGDVGAIGVSAMCLCTKPGHTREFRDLVIDNGLVGKGKSLPLHMAPSLDPNNPDATHFKERSSVQDKPPVQNEAEEIPPSVQAIPEEAVDKVKRLTAGLDLKDEELHALDSSIAAQLDLEEAVEAAKADSLARV